METDRQQWQLHTAESGFLVGESTGSARDWPFAVPGIWNRQNWVAMACNVANRPQGFFDKPQRPSNLSVGRGV